MLVTSPTEIAEVTSPIKVERPNVLPNAKKVLIGDYEVGRTLGQGAYGEVKLGKNLITGDNVAIKILDKEKQISARALKRIGREINILQETKHPNVIECYEVIETEKAWFLITEYCSGGELFDYILDQPEQCLSEAEAIQFFTQVLDGLEHLHNNGVSHRDLKLENILLDSNKNVKIADFGMSSKYDEGQTLKTRCGSPHYIPPEMVEGKPYNPLMSDIWSLGVCFFGMVAGYMPFDEEKNHRIFRKVLKGEFEMPENLTLDCEDLIHKMLDIDADTRITIAEIREHRLMHGPRKEVEICIEEL